MTPESEAELRANIKVLLDLVREQGVRQNAMAEDIAFIKGRLLNMPQPAEFYELRGRVEEISRRLPTTIAYAPPSPREKSAE